MNTNDPVCTVSIKESCIWPTLTVSTVPLCTVAHSCIWPTLSGKGHPLRGPSHKLMMNQKSKSSNQKSKSSNQKSKSSNQKSKSRNQKSKSTLSGKGHPRPSHKLVMWMKMTKILGFSKVFHACSLFSGV